MEFEEAMEEVHCFAPPMKVPVLMQIPGDDHLVDVAVLKSFYEKVGLKDKTLRIQKGLYHEICNELEPDRKDENKSQ